MKTAIRDRWGDVPLMDMLTETALRTGCLNVFTPAGTQNHLDAQVLSERLLLLIYAYGTGTRAVAACDHPHTEDDLRYARFSQNGSFMRTPVTDPSGGPSRQPHLPFPDRHLRVSAA
ncbi:Tn3 family transposase [Spirillospora sp. CA-294931]|uniref:Tn3 family transposase n=1 Tax=Spirillospora sp. CA-294931 TaxID=3240042 RepID=UPI003D9220E0